MKGTAQEGHAPCNRAPAGKSADRLIGHGFKNASGNFFSRHTAIEKRHNVGFGKNATARGNRVRAFGVFREPVKAHGIGVKERGHLVDKCARAARARFIHAQFHPLGEVNDFGVFAAQFHGDV